MTGGGVSVRLNRPRIDRFVYAKNAKFDTFDRVQPTSGDDRCREIWITRILYNHVSLTVCAI